MDYEAIRRVFPKAVLSVAQKGICASYFLDDDTVSIDETIIGDSGAILGELVRQSSAVVFKYDGLRVLKIWFSVLCDVEQPMIFVPLEAGFSKQQERELREELDREMPSDEFIEYMDERDSEIYDMESLSNVLGDFVGLSAKPSNIGQYGRWDRFLELVHGFHSLAPYMVVDIYEPDSASFSLPEDVNEFTILIAGAFKDGFMELVSSYGMGISVWNDSGRLVFEDFSFFVYSE